MVIKSITKLYQKYHQNVRHAEIYRSIWFPEQPMEKNR